MSASVRPLVAHVLFRLDTGGMENGVVNLVNRMQRDRFRHAIVALAGIGKLVHRLERTDVQLHSIDKAPGKDPAAYWRLYTLLRRLRPTIMHTRNFGTVDCQAVAALARVPCRVHGEHGWQMADVRGRDARARRLRRLCAPFTHQYVAMSRDIAGWLTEDIGIDGRRITQIYNGVDGVRFNSQGTLPPDLPWRTLSPGPFVIGTVGRLDPIKNQRGLLAAFGRLLEVVPSTRPDLRLMVVGSGPEAEGLQREAERAGLAERVWLPGRREDIPALLRAMDLFVLPSLNEGASNTILEAMASERPVLASRVGGNPELVQDGITGTLCDPGNTNELAAIMRGYVLDRARCARHGAAGRLRVLHEFTLDSMVKSYTNLYETVMNGRV